MSEICGVTSRAWVEIRLDALLQNFNKIRERTGRKIMCVIKGDAHGHGAVRCGMALEQGGADAFAVASLCEGVELREAGIKTPILILGWTPPACASELLACDLTQSILDEDYANQMDQAASLAAGVLKVHIKLDTGMSRTGIYAQAYPEKAAAAVCRIDGLKHLQINGIFTHFAVADDASKNDFTAWQLENYKAVLAALAEQGFTRKVIHHVSNSAGALYHPECYFDMVRTGVALYGFYPTNSEDLGDPLQPVLTLKARVAQVKELPAGATVSYGCTYTTSEPTRIAVVSAGYADSYPRTLSGKGAYAVINGHRCPQIGRICMDMCMFDISGVNVVSGDEVILYGRSGMSLENVTNLIGTINCEPTSLLTRRVAKVYIEE